LVAQLSEEFEAASVVIEQAEAERPLERRTDDEKAFLLAELGTSMYACTDRLFLDWVLAEVNHWVQTPEFVRPLHALTLALLHARSLTGQIGSRNHRGGIEMSSRKSKSMDRQAALRGDVPRLEREVEQAAAEQAAAERESGAGVRTRWARYWEGAESA
jgi:hypothetical protein